MKIISLAIEGFRSMKKVHWVPNNLNIIIGPNGAGKSNLLRFLELMTISAQAHLGKYIQSLGGMEPLVWDGQATGIGCQLKMSDENKILHYQLELARLGQSSAYRIEQECLANNDLLLYPITENFGKSMTKKYCIKRFYRARTQYQHHDDSLLEDQWQLEIYLHALGLMKKKKFKSIVDIGCGSGYKLVTYLGDYETLGLELPANVEILRKKYPERKWEVSDFSVTDITTDIVICADVIEHLVNPDELLDYIKCISYKYLILSTPDRNLVYRPWHKGYYGPPKNQAHIREWNFKEFGEYISMHFNVIDQRVTNLGQCTQMIICKPK